LTLNQETIQLYWSIGQDLSSRFAAEGWGTKVVEHLAKDLGTEFPRVEGFSLRNLRYIRSFAEVWPDSKILQLAAKLPWVHPMVLLDRLKDGQGREGYLRASIKHGRNRNVLTYHLSTQLREREGPD
jgi:predicted nuclease of restriction endonuclease-like (RecB) superfamily